MRTVTFKSLIDGVAALMGLDSSTSDLSPKKAQAYTVFLNARVAAGWQFDFWPEICPCEQRQFRDTWSDSTAYTADDEVFYSDKYYTALLDSTNEDPETATTYWEETTELDKYVAYDQTGETEIEAVESVSAKNPRVYPDYPGKYAFSFSNNGVQVSTLAGNKVWIVFRPPAPSFTAATWSATTSYSTGARVYLAATGECYLCLADHLNQNPATATTYWQKIDMPAFLASYAIRGAYADALRKDGQNDKADAEDTKTEEELDRIHDVLCPQQGIGKRAIVRC